MRSIILCHGFSASDGPDYTFIHTMKLWLRDLGWDVIVPDFRPSYSYGSSRGRSERCRIILECIIEMMAIRNGRPGVCVLIGHSQGGAAAAQVCSSEGIIKAAGIVGLVLLVSCDCHRYVIHTVKPLVFVDFFYSFAYFSFLNIKRARRVR